MKRLIRILGPAVLILGAFFFLVERHSAERFEARYKKEKAELGYLAKCVEEQTARLKRRPTKDEYLRFCMNPAPFLEDYERVKLDPKDQSYQWPKYDFLTVPFQDVRILQEHSVAPADGFVIQYWNGDNMDRYVSWEADKFFIR